MIMGVGGCQSTDLSPGDLVVGTEVGAVTCASAPLLAGELRRAGRPARTGRVTTLDHLVPRSERASLAAAGTLLAALESAPPAPPARRAPLGLGAAARCSWTNSTRCPTAPPSCSPRTACRRPCGRTLRGGGWR